MNNDQVRYPGPGCVVEFLQGNSPQLGIVLEEQSGRLRLYTQGKREVNLTIPRLLPWFGPMAGSNLSRLQMEQAMDQVAAEREALTREIQVEEVWNLAQGEVFKASALWLAGLVWGTPDVNHCAAMGRILLECKTHFRFSPPDFEIFTQEIAEKRQEEAENARIREIFAGKGATFFQTLWEIYLYKRPRLQENEEPDTELAERLRSMLLERIADPESTTDDTLWRMLVKPLPEHPHQALLLSIAWGIVPEHHNFYMDRCGFASGTEWAKPLTVDITNLAIRTSESLRLLPMLEDHESPNHFLPLISIDPPDSLDRDDAFWVSQDSDGNYQTVIALACPSLVWDFGSELDKAVFRRQSSLYLPEGDEHMLPAEAGWGIFGLDQQQDRPALVVKATISRTGELLDSSIVLSKVRVEQNLSLPVAEQVIAQLAAPTMQAAEKTPQDDDAAWQEFIGNGVSTSSEPAVNTNLAADHPAHAYADMLATARSLSLLLQAQRVSTGAVITERVDPQITLEKTSNGVQVHINTPEATPMSFLIIGELMILANSILANWAITHEVPIIFRVQDVTIPKECAGVWSHPADISRVIRGLPGASLEVEPKRHAGLGLAAYTSATSPIRRYLDLLNQSQIVSALQTGQARLSAEDIKLIHPVISNRLEGVMQVQRMRPRYWKLLHLRQVGAKAWWSAVVTEENSHFAGVTIPKLQLFLRGKRHLFPDKLNIGQDIDVRIGKVVPLLGEMSIAETKETD